MLHPSKRLILTIESVLDIAYFGDSGPVHSASIANRQHIPRRYLEQVLQHLVRSGIIAGHRGPRGGYRLARDKRQITLGEIVRALRDFEGSDDPIETSATSDIGNKILRPLWRDMQQKMIAELDSITLADLCQQAKDAGVPVEHNIPIDFSI